MPTTKKRRVIPFTAVIGQEEMKLALFLNVIDPRIILPGSWVPLFNLAASLIKWDAGGDLIIKSNFLSL